MSLDPTKLSAFGELLFGQNWMLQISQALRVNDRTVRHWLSGRDPIPVGIINDLVHFGQARSRDIWRAALKLQASVRPPRMPAARAPGAYWVTTGDDTTIAEVDENGDLWVIGSDMPMKLEDFDFLQPIEKPAPRSEFQNQVC